MDGRVRKDLKSSNIIELSPIEILLILGGFCCDWVLKLEDFVASFVLTR